MKSLDIIIVSYNSEKWIPSLLDSLSSQNYPLKKLHITFVDNGSVDNSRELLETYERKEDFGSYNYHFLDNNQGFGRANNYGVHHSKQDYVFFLNVDTKVDENCIVELMKSVEISDDSVGLWEARQFPYEHPKVYNPVTMETGWASGACSLVRRDYFEMVGKFDEKIFMYGEDVDLSWRLRAHGYKLIYVPKSIVYHYTYMSVGEIKPNQFYHSTYMNLMLRYKYGSIRDIIKGYVLYGGLFFFNGPARNHKSRILKTFLKSFIDGQKFRKWKRHTNFDFKANFKLWDYEINREGAFYANELPEHTPLVSILIRTCGRPSVLREALVSVRNQTYRNIEVVVVEDGPAISKQLVNEEFSDLNIIYKATKDKVGRCVVGNIALEIASGEYFNFLDDDDLLYADHVEVLVTQLMKKTDYKAAYSIGFEVPTKVISKEPYIYEEMFYSVQHKQRFDRVTLVHHNYLPIETVMFKRELFESLGGLDNELEVLEDWDLWLRYALKFDFLFIEKLTSLYRVPANANLTIHRQQMFDRYLPVVKNKNLEHCDTELRSLIQAHEDHINRKFSIFNKVKNMSFQTFLFKLKNKIYIKIKRLLS
ncbi:glycosyltransferase family 2 protein [Paenibacillus sp. 3LSP]|uniref:glycosyltransferase family 2 protein n=1 Tax=Paenibacillus sp. 3LSP TaxID=2800795 RepID=UPI0028FDBF87|nr:glycosyltransferase family 2 protein [Paenibacillus sp. 3LSP]MDU0332798.1 glycosyltransferase family 2 protein [Paenibacillus sp. 3LSP]